MMSMHTACTAITDDDGGNDGAFHGGDEGNKQKAKGQREGNMKTAAARTWPTSLLTLPFVFLLYLRAMSQFHRAENCSWRTN